MSRGVFRNKPKLHSACGHEATRDARTTALIASSRRFESEKLEARMQTACISRGSNY
jgi:hypothetical protein